MRRRLNLPPAAAGLSIGRACSERIQIARILCIFFMTFVHIQPGIEGNVYDRDAGAFDIVYFIFTRLLGLGSVALLSVISGYLVASSLFRTDVLTLIFAKVRTLLVPLAAWNALMFGLLVLHLALTGRATDMPELTPMGLVDALLAVSRWPVNVPLWFLRDLFVCCLLAPFICIGMSRFAVATVGALLLFSAFGADLHVLLRPQIVLFFGAGIWIRLHALDTASLDNISRILSVGLVATISAYLFMRIQRMVPAETTHPLALLADTMLRVTMAAGFWQLAKIVRHSFASRLFLQLEPYAFFLFCSHAIVFTLGGIFRRTFGNYGSEFFPVTFFTLPLLALVASIVGLQMLRHSRMLLMIFNAGRTPPPLFARGGGAKPLAMPEA